MDETWKSSFIKFLEDMGRKPFPRASIERLKNHLGYNKENCAWVTQKQQCNNRRSNRLITYNGETLNLTQWAEKLGVDRNNIKNRLKLGWDLQRIFTEPVRINSINSSKHQKVQTKPYVWTRIKSSHPKADSPKCNPMPTNWSENPNSLIKL